MADPIRDAGRTGAQVPYQNAVLSKDGYLSQSWEGFFRYLYNIVGSISPEISIPLEIFRDESDELIEAWQALEGIQFDSDRFNLVIIDYICQRISTGPDGEDAENDAIESGTLYLTYKAKSEVWEVKKVAGTDSLAGITFQMTDAGQLELKASILNPNSDLVKVNKITLRSRTMGARLKKPLGGWL